MTTLRQKGFTLIEMLIAMTLLGVMVVLLFSSLKIAAESWNAGEAKIIEVNRKAVVYQFFKRHLTTTRPVMVQTNTDELAAPEQAFQGQAQAMRFVAALPAASARKGLQVFEIAADPAEPSTIRVTLSPYQPTDQEQAQKPEILLEHVKAFGFSYFGKKIESDTEDANWQDDWTGAERLPQLIKVRFELDDGSFWPDMVFPLKISAQAAVDELAPEDNQAESQGAER